MTLNRNDIITIPTWVLTIVAPIVVTIVTSITIIRVNNARMEERIITIQAESQKKLNKAESDILFQNFQTQFNQINSNLEKIDRKIDNHLNGTK